MEGTTPGCSALSASDSPCVRRGVVLACDRHVMHDQSHEGLEAPCVSSGPGSNMLTDEAWHCYKTGNSNQWNISLVGDCIGHLLSPLDHQDSANELLGLKATLIPVQDTDRFMGCILLHVSLYGMK
jgi:hypothetical protein